MSNKKKRKKNELTVHVVQKDMPVNNKQMTKKD